MRRTKQKEVLQQQLTQFTSFFNAEELYRHVQKKNPNIGIATVYRFLKTREDQGELHSFICNRKTIYSTNKNNHCHFVCEKCGIVQHIPAKNLDFLSKSIAGEVCHVQIDVTGVCKDCLGGKRD